MKIEAGRHAELGLRIMETIDGWRAEAERLTRMANEAERAWSVWDVLSLVDLGAITVEQAVEIEADRASGYAQE